MRRLFSNSVFEYKLRNWKRDLWFWKQKRVYGFPSTQTKSITVQTLCNIFPLSLYLNYNYVLIIIIISITRYTTLLGTNRVSYQLCISIARCNCPRLMFIRLIDQIKSNLPPHKTNHYNYYY